MDGKKRARYRWLGMAASQPLLEPGLMRPGCGLDQMRVNGTTSAAAGELFDHLDPVLPQEMTGRWRGGGLHSGHALDGLLETFGWYGKEFHDADRVHPLLFETAHGPVPIDPHWLPLSLLDHRLTRNRMARMLFRLARPLLATRRPAARLRTVEWHGQVTAAMIYDRLPIVDIFKRAAPGLLLGQMDIRGYPPFFFTLERDECFGVAV